MADRIEPERRSANMARIRSKNTTPELIVRRSLHRLGYRFRVHWKGMPGRPDIALPGRKHMIFVHGCFWHQHPGCPAARIPATRTAFWEEKFAQNNARDVRNLILAKTLGWRVLVLWECEIEASPELDKRLIKFLGRTRYSKDSNLRRKKNIEPGP